MTILNLRILFLLGLLLIVAPNATAQTTAPVTQLAVEVRYFPGPSTAHIVVDQTEKHWIWFGRFARVANWAPPVNSLPLMAVIVNAQEAEAGVRVWVSVFRGKIHEEEQQISSYLLREGEAVT